MVYHPVFCKLLLKAPHAFCIEYAKNTGQDLCLISLSRSTLAMIRSPVGFMCGLEFNQSGKPICSGTDSSSHMDTTREFLEITFLIIYLRGVFFECFLEKVHFVM